MYICAIMCLGYDVCMYIGMQSVSPHAGQIGNIQVRLFSVFKILSYTCIFLSRKVVPIPMTKCCLNGGLIDHITKEFM